MTSQTLLVPTRPYQDKEAIFHEGGQPGNLYIIISGKIQIIKGQNQSPLLITELEQGQVFGESSLLGIQPHSASAIACQQTELAMLSRSQLFHYHTSDLPLFSMLILNLAREACRRLHQSDNLLCQYTS